MKVHEQWATEVTALSEQRLNIPGDVGGRFLIKFAVINIEPGSLRRLGLLLCQLAKRGSR